MAQWLRVHTALAEDPGSVSNTDISQLTITATLGILTPSSGQLWYLYSHIHMSTHTHTHTQQPF